MHLPCHRLRLVMDALPRAREPFSREKIGCYVEDGQTLDAYVIDLSDDLPMPRRRDLRYALRHLVIPQPSHLIRRRRGLAPDSQMIDSPVE